MYVINKMRLNKFEPKPIISNRELFISCGAQVGTINSKETADCYSEPSVDGASKTKILGLAKQIGETAYAKSREGDAAPSMPGKNAKDV